MDQEHAQSPNDKPKKSVKRSKSWFYSGNSKNQQDQNEFSSPPLLNRGSSQPESNGSTKFDTIKKSLLDRTQSMKKTTADFFGVNKEHEDENYQLWLDKRKRFYMKSGGKVKDKQPGSDTYDSQHLNAYQNEFDPFNRDIVSHRSKPSVMKIAYKGIKKLHKVTDTPEQASVPANMINLIPMSVVATSGYPQEISFKTCKFDDTTEAVESTSGHLQYNDSLIDASEYLPDDLIFKYEIPKSKTWTIVDREGIQRINSKLIESIYDNSDRRQYGMGFLGKLLNRKFKSNLTSEQKKQLNSIDDSRPYFTYWIMSVQLVIMLLTLLTYGFGQFGLQKVKISQPVLVNSLSIQEVSYFEPNNIWLGPRPADLIHLGAKFTPCMRKDKLIFDQINKERAEEKDTACCIRTDKSGCIQTKQSTCSPLLSTWKKYTIKDNVTYLRDNRLEVRTSGSVCGQDPRYCLEPKSWFPNIWPDDITQWPICRTQVPISKNGDSNLNPHMNCNLIGKPCCIGIHGECKITTRDYCDFVKGFFHEEATLCSQVSCMSDVCGMLQIKRDDNLLQIYRLWTSLFLHAGFLHILISFAFQYYVIRDFEKLIGSTRICIIYMLSGIGGNFASAIFVPYRAEVGPGGSQFGILAGLIAEQIHSWNLIENPWHQLSKLIGIAFVLFLYGLLPWIDNYAHIFGFAIGFLLSLALLPFLTFTEKVKRKIKLLLIWTCFFIVFLIFMALFLFFYYYPIYECKYCSWLNCIPLTQDWCSDHQIAITRKDIL